MDFKVKSGPEGIESELPALKQLVALGYNYRDEHEINSKRAKYSESVLYDRLDKAIRRNNPDLNDAQVRDAMSQLSEENYRYDLPPVDTNEEIWAKLVSLSRSGGLKPVFVSCDDGSHKSVKIFDFDNIDNNEFIVTNQFRIQGHKSSIHLDIVVFVNGIPLVVIECKSPTVSNSIEKAHAENLAKYQTQKHGFSKIFYYNHCIITTDGINARVGTVQADLHNYAKWSSTYPHAESDVRKMCDGQLREQEVLIAGLLSKKNLLDHLQSFVIFEIIDGNKVKKIAKHQQFRVVNESLSRMSTRGDLRGKGGVVWHTQGSGKSLSMVWLATKIMYEHDNPPIIIITDRKQLDKQIHDTFKKCGFPTPIRATNKKHLEDLLSNPRGKTIMTVLDKFSEGEIRTDEKIICLVDEAHRSHFKVKAAEMRGAMPNAIFFGFTGTPIDKADRSSYGVFGDLIDKYGFEESQYDGATLPIRYEGRMPRLFIEGNDTVDQLFERIMSQDPAMTPERKTKLKQKYVTPEKIAESPSRIKQIAKDIQKHYVERIKPNGYKAMLAAPSREAAVLYKQELDALGGITSKIIMTSELGETGKDGKIWDEYYLSSSQREIEAEKFKRSDDPTDLLIVVDMLLVGYDVPICQVLYLDRGLREHNLLQAIARVNRPYDEPKTYGLVVDYSGISKKLDDALKMFDERDIRGAMAPLEDLLNDLKTQHLRVMKYFEGVDLSNHSEVIEKFDDIVLRKSLESDFKRFSRALDAVLPNPTATVYLEDFKRMIEIRHILHNYYRDDAVPNTRSYAKKIQRIIDDHVKSSDVLKIIRPVELSHRGLMADLHDTVKSPKARAAVIKANAISIIHELYPSNPAFYENLLERLKRIIEDENMRRLTNAVYFTDPKEYVQIYNEAMSERNARRSIFGDYDATQFEFAVFEILKSTTPKQSAINTAKNISRLIQPHVGLIDWKNKPTVKKEMVRTVYEQVKEFHDSYDESISLSKKIVDTAVNTV